MVSAKPGLCAKCELDFADSPSHQRVAGLRRPRLLPAQGSRIEPDRTGSRRLQHTGNEADTHGRILHRTHQSEREADRLPCRRRVRPERDDPFRPTGGRGDGGRDRSDAGGRRPAPRRGVHRPRAPPAGHGREAGSARSSRCALRPGRPRVPAGGGRGRAGGCRNRVSRRGGLPRRGGGRGSGRSLASPGDRGSVRRCGVPVPGVQVRRGRNVRPAASARGGSLFRRRWGRPRRRPARSRGGDRDQRRKAARPRPRQPARKRVHAIPSRRMRARPRGGVRLHVRGGPRRRTDARARHGRTARGRRREPAAAEAHRPRVRRGRSGRGPRRARRKGRDVRFRRDLHQAGRGHGRNEVRHVRRGERARGGAGGRGACSSPST